MLYTFRILLDYEHDVFRDIQIKGSQNFIELHKAIQNAFGFDNTQISSFYLSDDEWSKGDEISMMDMAGEQGEGTSFSMSDTSIESLAQTEGQKLVYVSDFFLMWCFFVELVKISEPVAGFEYPSIVLSVGDAPEQYSKDADIEFEVENTSEDTEEEGDIFDGFDDFEDYQ
ncbi:MAG: hypothetical protein JKY42_03665 [Flavobacteriales bacterium]|nr:hypothetical protein [Flavobacteriales bacterium]